MIHLLIATVAILILLGGVVAMQPPSFRITRTAVISAPATTVFALVNDLHRWQAWSPWEDIDPQLKRTYAGAPAGTGAIYSWTGNNKVGAGRMTIIDSHPSDLIRLKLEFLKPFAATHLAEFDFQQEGDKTNITWSMSGRKGLLVQAMSLVVKMDKMIGSQFEKGLARLKTAAEAAASGK